MEKPPVRRFKNLDLTVDEINMMAVAQMSTIIGLIEATDEEKRNARSRYDFFRSYLPAPLQLILDHQLKTILENKATFKEYVQNMENNAHPMIERIKKASES